MYFTSISVQQITSNCPNPNLPIIIGEPNHDQLIQMHKKLCANVVSVSSKIGSVQHINLSNFMYHEYYRALNDHAFVAPHNHGDYPTQTLEKTTLGKITHIHKYCNKLLQIYKCYTNTKKYLKLQIDYAMEPE